MGRAICIRKGGAGRECAKADFANRTWSPEDREREKNWPLGQDHGSSKLDTRQKIEESCALGGEGYVH